MKAQSVKFYAASESFNAEKRGDDRFRIVFYNVENLFDYFNDSTTLDEEFLPRGGRFWTKERYLKKQADLAKTLIAIGGWEPPALIGLGEVENRYVLNSLVGFTALKPIGYEIIHQDSEDRRGIDVAAIYRPDKFKLIDYQYYQIRFPFDESSRTRDILHVVGELPNRDTLHYFVNHWPSKFGGEFETKPKRLFTAQFLKHKVDSTLNLNPNHLIVITGDFNDEPDAESLLNGLETSLDPATKDPNTLYNLMYEMMYLIGTHSFENKWSIIDHFVVNGRLKNGNSTTRIFRNSAQIFDMPFLIMEGATGTTRPFRTYQGPKYVGGFSDHLPILLDLVLK
ncbi:hypothetical protein BFP71_13355 [Roseivirga misakiensis]|uniref:Endonuclease/exonuclease/phosphatase domain-containing protein n=1 Tax=Roseivirga misakiensis TaxID=1563681 RepID=A0A1E5T2H3_9BACT|nr:hypothetical protein BFP71_13355 [Roseivirga misakiensis]